MTEAIALINSHLANATMLSSLALEPDASTGMYDLLIKVRRSDCTDEELAVRFANVADMKINVDAGGLIQFMMLRVEFAEEGFERRYLVTDREHEALSLRCASVKFEWL